MKKPLFLLIAVALLAFSAQAIAEDIVKLRTSELALRVADDNGQLGEWSEWETNSMPIVVTNNTIVIYSSEQQEYDAYEWSDQKDAENDYTIKMSAIDKKGVRCEARFRHKDDYWQLYVDYSNMSWVYNVEMTYSDVTDGSNSAAAILAKAMKNLGNTTSSVKAQTKKFKFEAKTVAERRYTEAGEWGEWSPAKTLTQNYFLITSDTITAIEKNTVLKFIVDKIENEKSDGVSTFNFAMHDTKIGMEAILSLQVPPEGNVKIFFTMQSFCLCYEVRIMGEEECIFVEIEEDKYNIYQ